MGLLKCADSYWKFLGTCTQCGHCTNACMSLTKANMTLGDIARAMLAAERQVKTADELHDAIAGNADLVQAVRGCFFCTLCKNTCFAHNDVCDLIYHARVDFQELGLIPRDAWASVLVDQEWDIFTAYRAVHGISLNDLMRHLDTKEGAGASDCEVAFFPGCSMASYAPDLTREIFATIEELGGKTTLIDKCCGSSLKSAGFFDRAEALCDVIAGEVAASGAKQVVCVCPGCANAIYATLERNGVNAQVVSLSAFLSGHDFVPKHAFPKGPLWLSKSCQDRDGSYLLETCKALGISPDTPSIFHGCCGAGGAVSAYQPDRQSEQADSKLGFAPDGATVVTMCPTCTYTYAYRLMSVKRDITNKHYTELLFNEQFDWSTVFNQLGNMWHGQYGAWLASVLG